MSRAVENDTSMREALGVGCLALLLYVGLILLILAGVLIVGFTIFQHFFPGIGQ